MVIAACEAGLMPSEVMPIVHLSYYQGNRRAVPDTMEGDLLGAYKDVLKAAHHQVPPGIQIPSDIIRRKLEGLQLLR